MMQRHTTFFLGLILIGCASTKPIILRQNTSLCLEAIKSDEITKEEAVESLRRVRIQNPAFAGYGCDTTANKLIVSIDKTNINGKGSSYYSVFANIYMPAAGLYLALTSENSLWLLLGLVQISPSSFIKYRIEYQDGKSGRKAISKGTYWFMDKKQTKREVLIDFSKRIELSIQE